MAAEDKVVDTKPDAAKDVKPVPATNDDLSAEDRELQSNLELLVDVITEHAKGEVASPSTATTATNMSDEQIAVQKNALVALAKEIKSSTSSMTSIPKPLKFLKPHYQKLIDYHTSLPANHANRKFLADILSVLSMTQQPSDARPTLNYKMMGDPSLEEGIGMWGHEYVRHLAGEIGKEFTARQAANKSLPYTDLDTLVDQIVPFFMTHHAEFDAVDLLIEVEALPKIQQFLVKDIETSSDSYHKASQYILKCSDLIIDHEEQRSMFEIVYQVYLSHEQFADALLVAIRMHDTDLMTQALETAEAKDEVIAKQLCYILGAHRIVLESYLEKEPFNSIMGNTQLSQHYATLAAELDVKEAKTPEDIYKTHLEEGGTGRRPAPRAGASASSGVDSAKQNLASTFVNAFVNAGFCKDTLVTPEGSDWMFKNKSHGMISAAASIGMISMWDVENGFNAVDRYSFSVQNQIKAGTYLAHGILSSGITSEMDAAQALLSEHVESTDVDAKLMSVLGLGIAYVNTARSDILELLIPLIVDATQTMEVVAHACLALGMVYVGTASEDISGSIIEAFLDRTETDLNDSTARLMSLGMGLLFLGRGADVEPVMNALAVIEHPIKKYLELTVTSCAHVGVASPLELQKYLTVLLDHVDVESTGDDKEAKDAAAKEGLKTDPLRGIHQEVAVIGLALVSMTEELTAEMAFRTLDHVLQYGEVNVRRVVPLALGLLSISNPRLTVLDTLSKLSHDSDQIVSQNGIFAMGLVGAGTNNSRIATMLRTLASYYNKEPNHLFLVRIAQGLLHLGKGLLTLNPSMSDGFTLNRSSMAGLLTVIHASLDMQHTILGKRHYLLFSLVTAMRPRWLMTVNEDGEQLKVSVRVGQKVDVVGQPGKPKSITGFQSHTTPVLIAVNERAELATDEYLPCTRVLEGIVILKKNPDYKPTA